MRKLNLKTVRVAAREHGLPYQAILDAVNNQEVRTVTIGRRPMLPSGALEEFLRRRTTKPRAIPKDITAAKATGGAA